MCLFIFTLILVHLHHGVRVDTRDEQMVEVLSESPLGHLGIEGDHEESVVVRFRGVGPHVYQLFRCHEAAHLFRHVVLQLHTLVGEEHHQVEIVADAQWHTRLVYLSHEYDAAIEMPVQQGEFCHGSLAVSSVHILIAHVVIEGDEHAGSALLELFHVSRIAEIVLIQTDQFVLREGVGLALVSCELLVGLYRHQVFLVPVQSILLLVLDLLEVIEREFGEQLEFAVHDTVLEGFPFGVFLVRWAVHDDMVEGLHAVIPTDQFDEERRLATAAATKHARQERRSYHGVGRVSFGVLSDFEFGEFMIRTTHGTYSIRHFIK